jgi:serine phosphatase RsbU (regulator of sigma subunit)
MTFLIDDDHPGVVIADVSGKGVPAALFMMISKTVVQNYAILGIGAAEVLRRATRFSYILMACLKQQVQISSCMARTE